MFVFTFANVLISVSFYFIHPLLSVSIFVLLLNHKEILFSTDNNTLRHLHKHTTRYACLCSFAFCCFCLSPPCSIVNNYFYYSLFLRVLCIFQLLSLQVFFISISTSCIGSLLMKVCRLLVCLCFLFFLLLFCHCHSSFIRNTLASYLLMFILWQFSTCTTVVIFFFLCLTNKTASHFSTPIQVYSSVVGFVVCECVSTLFSLPTPSLVTFSYKSTLCFPVLWFLRLCL